MCAGSNLFRMYVTYRFIRIFLEETKLSRVKEVACYLLFWIVNTALYLLFQRVWINIVCNLVGIALLVRMYTKVWKENIFVTVSIYMANLLCDVFVSFLFSSSLRCLFTRLLSNLESFFYRLSFRLTYFSFFLVLD